MGDPDITSRILSVSVSVTAGWLDKAALSNALVGRRFGCVDSYACWRGGPTLGGRGETGGADSVTYNLVLVQRRIGGLDGGVVYSPIFTYATTSWSRGFAAPRFQCVNARGESRSELYVRVGWVGVRYMHGRLQLFPWPCS